MEGVTLGAQKLNLVDSGKSTNNNGSQSPMYTAIQTNINL